MHLFSLNIVYNVYIHAFFFQYHYIMEILKIGTLDVSNMQ